MHLTTKSPRPFAAVCFACAIWFAVQPAPGAITNPSTSRPVPLGDNGSEPTLQEVFDAIVTSGSIDAQLDQVTNAVFHPAGSPSFATFVVSIAGLAGSNKFGIYKSGDPDNRVEILSGVTSASASQDKSVKLIFGNGDVFLGDELTKAQTGPEGSFGTSFGFYLEVVENDYQWSLDLQPFSLFSEEGLNPIEGCQLVAGVDIVQPYTLYSEDRLNPIDPSHSVADGDAAQALIYKGKGQGMSLASDGVFGPTDVIIAWEDLVRGDWEYDWRRYGRSDGDFQDLVVLVEGVAAAPEPCSLIIWSLLGVLGIVAGWRRRVGGARR
jgi:hypothetical protein